MRTVAIASLLAAMGLAFITVGLVLSPHRDSKATVMVHAQAPDADCTELGAQNGYEVSICTVKDQTFVSVYSAKHPWQVFALQTQAQREAAAKPPAPAPAPAPAGSGAGSGSGK